MKSTNWMLAAALAFASLGGLSIATSTPANAWYCQARGTTGAWGWGRSWNLGQAKGIALSQCAVRTPRYARCYIVVCR